MDPLLSQCKSFAETVHTDHDRVTSDIKRVYQLSLQIAQRKRYIAELLFQTNLKYEPVITKMESQIQQSVDKLDPIVRYLSTKV
jgi:hypothetical protein